MPPTETAQRGPHAVGVLQTEIPSPQDPLDPARVLPCEIWYPAEPGATAREDAPHLLGLPHRAAAGLAPMATPRPLVAFSHGNSGLRQQSTFLTTHLASWGFVVAAPDHVGNTFAEMLSIEDDEERRSAHLRARAQRPQDLRTMITSLVDAAHAELERPPIDENAIGVLGHSYGGWTALKMPGLETRVKSVCALAPASEPFVGRKAFGPHELPLPSHVECLLVAARDDVLVDLATSVEPLYARLGPSAALDVLDSTDHFHFCDGIELLHKMHENTPRPNQSRSTRPLAELRGEQETHDWLNERVTRFFLETLGGATK